MPVSVLIEAMGDYRHADPEKARRGCHARGHIIVVEPGGHEWGGGEEPPKFFQLDLLGVNDHLKVRELLTQPEVSVVKMTPATPEVEEEREVVIGGQTHRVKTGRMLPAVPARPLNERDRRHRLDLDALFAALGVGVRTRARAEWAEIAPFLMDEQVGETLARHATFDDAHAALVPVLPADTP